MTRIALIHALEESVEPARTAFARDWPEAFAFDLLDTSLAVDRAAAGELTLSMVERFKSLGHYAANNAGSAGNTVGILFTCSAFGPAIDAVKATLSIPCLKPNESAFRLALSMGNNIGLMVTFGPSADALEAELLAMSSQLAREVKVRTVVVEGALAALKRGVGALHDQLVTQASASFGSDLDCLILGQFSLARARSSIVAAGTSTPVITTPAAAVQELRQLVAAKSGTQHGPPTQSK
jgi:Asp/Glu/hydantoin racemase